MKHIVFALSLFTAFAASPALAYVGPGPGLTMIGSLIGLIGSVLVALLMILAWPMRLYYKKMKAKKAATAGDAPAPASTDTPPSA